MCGRYELHSHPAAIALVFGLAHPRSLHPRFNIAPMTDVPVVRVNAQGERELTTMRWGLVPRWAKDPTIGAKLINARGETIAEKPSFRMAYRRHRCLLPADGFYERMPVGSGGDAHKQPVHVGMKDGRTFGFAGLYERWLSPEGDVLDTCTIVTTDANPLLRPVHDRMPVIVAPADYARWLEATDASVADLLAPFPSERMAWYPVSTKVNNVRHDDASLIEHVAVPPGPASGPPAAQAASPAPPGRDPEQESLF